MHARPTPDGRGSGADRAGALVGLGLKAPHWRGLLDEPGRVGWLEVHAENCMGAGGPPHRWLAALADHYALSVHGVGLSLGGAEAPEPGHLRRLAGVIERLAPRHVSEHLAWSSVDGVHLNDLLPVPYDAPTLDRLADHVGRVQDALGRRILIENPSRYFAFAGATMDEGTFLARLVGRTGCGLLLDVNNVVVSAANLDADPADWIDRMPLEAVEEVHLAGHSVVDAPDGPIRIDDHGSPVPAAVWSLYARLLARIGPVPTLIEWDTDVPPLAVLLAEAETAIAHLAAAAPPAPVDAVLD